MRTKTTFQLDSDDLEALLRGDTVHVDNQSIIALDENVISSRGLDLLGSALAKYADDEVSIGPSARYSEHTHQDALRLLDMLRANIR